MKARLTNKQLSVYCFMQDFFRENDMLPTGEMIAKHLGVSHPYSGWCQLKALKDKGYIERNAAPSKYRFTREVQP